MDDEQKANVFMMYFIGLALFLFLKTDYVATFLSQASLPVALAAHIILNPAYLIIVFGIVNWRRDKVMSAFLSGILLVLAIDIVSPPRLGMAIPAAIDASTATNIDYVFWQSASHFGIAYPIFRIAYYLIFPLLLIYLSVQLLGMKVFWQKIKGMGKLKTKFLSSH